jgi:hypothetical protein
MGSSRDLLPPSLRHLLGGRGAMRRRRPHGHAIQSTCSPQVYLDVDASTATRTVEPLVRLALVLRTVDKVDRRYVTLTPTAKGKEASARITEGLHAMMREVLGGMAPRKRLLLTKFLKEYVQLLDGYAARHGR